MAASVFTGLVQDVGVIERLQPGGMTELWIRTALGARTFDLGESIAVDGACLTVVKTRARSFLVQASPETLRRTTLGSYRVGTRVNLERALALGDRLGGHLVLGHVDAVTTILGVGKEGDARIVELGLPPALAPYFIEKGSACVDGVSLTVNALSEDRLSVALIPETQERTTLGAKRVGAKVNLEADLIGKHLARLYALRATPLPKAEAPQPLLSPARLRERGYDRKSRRR